MSEEGPKLYTNKPKKAQIKQLQEEAITAAPSSAAAASYKMGSQSTAPPPPPPPPPPKKSFARRYKFVWPLLFTVNLAVGGYLFLRTKKKDIGPEEEGAKNVPSAVSSSPTATSSITEKSVAQPAVAEPVKLREPIPENQQRELYKWMLEEKRKVKAKGPEEKKRIDEQKAILKQFIRAKSIPTI